MRPVRLEVEGFGAFRDRVDIDFSDVDYMVLVGSTGSGKSTVIDAVCFALYGSVPRYGDMRRVGYAVTTGATEARVSFTFDAGGQRYVATRVVRVKADGKAVTREARLEVVDPDGTRPVAGSAGELDGAVVRLLGMPFEHFTRCVVLPQGEFARFLSDQPRKRQDMLVHLLGLDVYGAMGKRANERKAFHEGQATQLRARVEALAFATPEAAEATTARLAQLHALAASLAAARAELGALDGLIRQADEEAARAAGLATRLEAVRIPRGVAEAGAVLGRARAELATARADLARRVAECSAAEEARRALGERQALDAVALDYRRLAQLAAEAEAAEAPLEAATATAEEARRRSEQAAAALAGAEEVAAATQAARAAHLLAERLVPGQPCPVCHEPVTSVPEHPPAPDLVAARQAVEQARHAAGEAAKAATAAAGRQAAQAEMLRQRRQEAEALRRRLATGPTEDEVRSRLAGIDAADRASAMARQEDQRARTREQDALRAHDEAARAVEQLRAAFEQTRDGLAPLGPPPAARTDLMEDWRTLAAWAGAEAPGQRKVEHEARAEADRLRRSAEGRRAEAVAACLAAGVAEAAATTRLETLEQSCLRAEATARGDLERIRAAMDEAASLAGQAAAADEAAAVAKELGRHLSAKGFERWMLSETMDALVAGASVILRELSSDAYSLVADEDGEFWVLDHRNADERRSAKTLSGGETFQASLALALSLAEQLSSLASAGAAPIEATFIDEGFGTLDADTLDTVAATLENLVGDDRLVGIVTHVRELAERVPVRFEVTKGPSTSSVTKVVT